MKKSTMSLLVLSLMFVFGCSTEGDQIDENNNNPNFRVYDAIIKGSTSIEGDRSEEGCPVVNEDACLTTNLIAGQNNLAGQVTVTTDGENLIITYETCDDWTIDLTHLSIGDCEQSIPTTGSGNPKVGHFEHTEPHSIGTNQVVYMISLDAIPESYCFAAHAEVDGPTGGETAWAEGPEFDGNSWAMYVEALLSDCPTPGEEEEEGEEGDGSDEE